MVFLIDLVFFGGALKAVLPRSPEHYFLVSIFLGAPHIIASNLLLVTNRDYWAHYGTRVIVVATLLGLALAIGNSLLPYNAIFFVVASWTIVHVVKQQLGVGNGFYRLPKMLYQLWGNAIILLGIVIYNIVFLERHIPENILSLLHWLIASLAAAIIVLTLIAHPRAKSTTGRVFLWANTLMILASLWMFYERCFFFTILIPRFIHDVTAFVFYAVHDQNKHGASPKNMVFKLSHALKIPALVMAPLTAVLITVLLKKAFDPAIEYLATTLFASSEFGNLSFFIIGFLSLIHYYTESFTWKVGSPYRQFVKFS